MSICQLKVSLISLFEKHLIITKIIKIAKVAGSLLIIKLRRKFITRRKGPSPIIYFLFIENKYVVA